MGQSPSYGGMTNEQVLSGAMEVFNESIMTGNQQGGTMPGDQGNQSSVLDGTASATRSSQGGMDGTMGQNDGYGTQSENNGTMGQQADGSGMETGDSEGSGPIANTPGSTGADMTGSGQQTGTGSMAGSIPGGTGQFPGSTGSSQDTGTGYNMSGRRIIIIGDNSGVLTDEERVQQYDRELEEQMQVFDGIILGQRQENIARTNEEGAGNVVSSTNGNGGGFGGDSTFESAPLLTTASASATADPNNNRTGGVLPDAPGDNRQGDYQNQSGDNSNLPPDIGDGSDDDIVARQLREAAIAEQDPDLKEKLWDEYRKYKQGVQARR